MQPALTTQLVTDTLRMTVSRGGARDPRVGAQIAPGDVVGEQVIGTLSMEAATATIAFLAPDGP
jgi:hypothetical protein